MSPIGDHHFGLLSHPISCYCFSAAKKLISSEMRVISAICSSFISYIWPSPKRPRLGRRPRRFSGRAVDHGRAQAPGLLLAVLQAAILFPKPSQQGGRTFASLHSKCITPNRKLSPKLFQMSDDPRNLDFLKNQRLLDASLQHPPQNGGFRRHKRPGPTPRRSPSLFGASLIARFVMRNQNFRRSAIDSRMTSGAPRHPVRHPLRGRGWNMSPARD